MSTFKDRIETFIKEVEDVEIQQKANLKTIDQLQNSIQKLRDENAINAEELEIATNAILILRQVSDEAVQSSYEFITESINAALERIFEKTTRKIRLKEYTRSNQYPQLEVELLVEGGKVRSLKTGSGHGLMQIISLLCILSLIVITHSRKMMGMDEILSGLSAKARRIVAEIMWTFTEIGFQFIVSEHGLIPKGANVYLLQMDGGTSKVAANYIEQKGVYLDGSDLFKKASEINQYGENAIVSMPDEDEPEDNTEEVYTRGEVQGEFKGGNVISID